MEPLERFQPLDLLTARVRRRLPDAGLAGPDAREQARRTVWALVEDEAARAGPGAFSPEERAEAIEAILRGMFGLGPLDPLLGDPAVTEVMVNGPDKVFVERQGRMQRAVDTHGRPLRFSGADEVMHLIDRIVAPVNRRVDESNPIVDARLPDGSRVNVVLRPIALGGPVLTIRRFPATPFSLADLVRLGAVPEHVAHLLSAAVRHRRSMVISGGTGTGKTTFLNALAMEIEAEERIVTVEDSAELRLPHVDNLVALEARPPNIEGKGAVTIRDLVRTALRMRPDRIIVGEVRGGEALDMLQAMNTGHKGSITTLHANSARDALSRLETMVLMAGLELPLAAVRRQISGAVELLVHLSRRETGDRCLSQVAEMADLENGEFRLRELYREGGGTT